MSFPSLRSLRNAALAMMAAGLLGPQLGFAEEEEAATGLPIFISARPFVRTVGNETQINADTLSGESGWAVGGSIGVRLTDYAIYELISVDYAQSRYGDEKFDNLVLISGFRFGVFNDSLPVKPYGLVGLGAIRTDLRLASLGLGNVTDWSLAWQLGAGVSYPLSKCCSAGISYRYTRSKSSNSDHRMPPFDWVVGFHSLGVEINFDRSFLE